MELVPDHPTALAGLAPSREKSSDPRAYAEARLREAEALNDIDACVEAFMSAGRTLAEQVGDIEGARKAFARALSIHPCHAEATWALAGLVEQGGDPETASSLLENQLHNEALEPSEKTKILTPTRCIREASGGR